MMKKLFLLVLVSLLVTFVKAQTESAFPIGTKEGAARVLGALYVDSVFYFPKRLPRTARTRDTGASYYRIADSSLYTWTGSQWIKSSGGSSYTAGYGLNLVTTSFSADSSKIATIYNVNKLGKTYPNEGTIGTQYEKTNWSSGDLAAEFSLGSNLTMSLSNGYPSITSSTVIWGGNSIARYLPKLPSLLPYKKIEVDYKITSGLSGNIGFGPSFYSNNVNGSNWGYTTYLSSGTSTATPHLAKQDGTIDQTGTTFTISLNDIIRQTLEFRDSIVIATFQNITTGSAVSTITKNLSVSTTPYPANTGTWAFQNFGGTYEIRRIKISSTTITNPTLMVAFDSKGQVFANNFGSRFSTLLNARYPTVLNYSGGGDQLTDLIAKSNEVNKINPEQVLIGLGSNDLRYGASITTVAERIDKVAKMFNGSSTRYAFTVIPEDSTAGGLNGLTALKNYLASAYPSNYIDLWTFMSTSNKLKAAYNSGDGVHPNNEGNRIIDSLIAASNFFTTRSTNRRTPFQKNDGNIVFTGDSLHLNFNISRGSNVIPKFNDTLNMVPSIIVDNGTQLHISNNHSASSPVANYIVTADGGIASKGTLGGYVMYDRANPLNYYGIYSNANRLSFLYNGFDKTYINEDGEIINGIGGSYVDRGNYKIQNTGDIYQQGGFRLGGTNVSSSPIYLLTKQTDSTVSQLAFTGSTSNFLRADGTWATASGSGLSGLTATRVPVASSSTSLVDYADLTYTSGTKFLNVPHIAFASDTTISKKLVFSDADTSVADFTHVFEHFHGVNAPTSNLPNSVYSMGFNVNNEKTWRHKFRDGWEYRFADLGGLVVERHIGENTLTTGTVVRHISFGSRIDTRNSYIYQKFGSYTFMDDSDSTNLAFNNSTMTYRHLNGGYFRIVNRLNSQYYGIQLDNGTGTAIIASTAPNGVDMGTVTKFKMPLALETNNPTSYAFAVPRTAFYHATGSANFEFFPSGATNKSGWLMQTDYGILGLNSNNLFGRIAGQEGLAFLMDKRGSTSPLRFELITTGGTSTYHSFAADGSVSLSESTQFPTARLEINGGSSSFAALKLEPQTAPTSPNNGDVWTTTAGIFARINGVTKQLNDQYVTINNQNNAISTDDKILIKGADSVVRTLPYASTTYTPTKTDIANVSSASVTTSAYQRLGDVVEVWGEVTLQATTNNTLTEFRITLPIASNLANTYDLSGQAQADGESQGIRVYGDATNDAAKFGVKISHTNSTTYSFNFKYKIK